MLKSASVTKLNGHITRPFVFHNDLNIFTGPNGSGKTSLLKAIWYIISGNIELIPIEVVFDSIVVETNKYRIEIDRSATDDHEFYFRFRLKIIGAEYYDYAVHQQGVVNEAPEIRTINYALAASGSSYFLPTFRRIEGGFLTSEEKEQIVTIGASGLLGASRHFQRQYDIQSPLRNLAGRLSSIGSHFFIAGVSTRDIEQLLTSSYAAISTVTNRNHATLVEEIRGMIRKHRNISHRGTTEDKLDNAARTLADVSSLVERFDQIQIEQLRPFEIVSRDVERIFKGKGIQITNEICLGDKETAIPAFRLSGGEKQMLSFLCYNAFNTNTMMFVDEPELSLHVDWQRTLFSTLLNQSAGNQFIVATHSPFIYSKFPDKEIVVGPEK